MPLGVASTTDLQDLEARLAALEEQLADVRAPQAGQDSLTPSYLTVDPATGKVSAQFDGAITARGVNIASTFASVFAPAADNERAVTWRAEITGNVDGRIWGTTLREMKVSAGDTIEATLLNANGASSFLQVASGLTKSAVDSGVGTFTWPGGTATSNVAGYAHNLGRVPTAVLITPTYLCTPYVTVVNEFGFNAQAYYPAGNPAAGATVGFKWLAIG